MFTNRRRIAAFLTLAAGGMIMASSGIGAGLFALALMAIPLMPGAWSQCLGVNSQVGRELAQETAPVFEHFTVRFDTWKEAQPTKVTGERDATGKTFNWSADGERGVDATCDLLPDTGYQIYANDVLTEVLPEDSEATPRVYVVVDPGTRSKFGPMAQVITGVKLALRPGVDTDQVTVET